MAQGRAGSAAGGTPPPAPPESFSLSAGGAAGLSRSQDAGGRRFVGHTL
ncbi:MAG: hypothetical protein KME26_31695 [Oscillatoria princeps RMCB-10]|nr:hypothetical protein [Oscillatoria princeps RMCB-10]